MTEVERLTGLVTQAVAMGVVFNIATHPQSMLPGTIVLPNGIVLRLPRGMPGTLRALVLAIALAEPVEVDGSF